MKLMFLEHEIFTCIFKMHLSMGGTKNFSTRDEAKFYFIFLQKKKKKKKKKWGLGEGLDWGRGNYFLRVLYLIKKKKVECFKCFLGDSAPPQPPPPPPPPPPTQNP
jgi:hypothetical protein